MAFYQVPTKSDESVYCRKDPIPEECVIGQGYATEAKHFGEESLEVVVTEAGEVSVVARVDIPEMSYIDTGRLVHVSRQVEEIMAQISEKHDSIEDVFAPIQNFIRERSNNSSVATEDGLFAPTSITSFIKYASSHSSTPNNKANIAPLGSYLISLHPEKVQNEDYRPIYNTMSILVSRHLASISSGYLLTIQSVNAGETLLISS